MSVRSVLVPGAALALAATVALSPAVMTPAMAPAPPAIPSVHIDDVQLAGIGQDIYYAITPTVQYAVGGVSYLINFIPVIGGVIAAQININYYQGIQPVVEATVNALAGVVQDPRTFFGTLSAYATTLYDIAYNWVSAELQWIGLGALPLLPSLPVASVGRSAAARTAARPRTTLRAPVPVAVELPAPVPVVPRIMCCTPQPQPPAAAAGPRTVVRDVLRSAAKTSRGAAASPARGQAARAVRATAPDTAG